MLHSSPKVFHQAIVASGLFLAIPALLWAQPPEPPVPLPPVTRTTSECPSLEELGYRDKFLPEIELNIAIVGRRLPADCSTQLFYSAPHGHSEVAPEQEFNWAASELYHQPLYFDDTILERYGQAYHPLIQPWVSGAHFFTTFPVIPYKIGLDRTHDHVYTLGYYRPGSPNPCLRRRFVWEADAAGFEAATWLALIFLLP